MSRIEMMHTGRAMKNQIPQDGWGRMFCRAIMFCGEAMGEAAPPMLEARAMPRIRDLEKAESEGRLRRRGYENCEQTFWGVSRGKLEANVIPG